MAHGKKYQDALKLVDRTQLYQPAEAVDLVKQTSTVSFDPSVEAHLRLGVDPRHADQMVRGTVVLPHGTGKVVRVAVFAQGDKAQEALRAGADEVGGEDLVKKIEAGWLEFDVALATPDMMGQVGRLGRILGRRGLMPNPKAGTITFDLERAIREVKGGRVEFKVDKGGDRPRPGRQGELRAGAAGREPRHARRCGQPREAVGRQGPVLADADDREHDGPGHPGRYPGRPRERGGIAPGAARLAADRPLSSTTRRAFVRAEDRTTDPPETACALEPWLATERRPSRRTGSRDERGDADEHAEAGVDPPGGGTRPLHVGPSVQGCSTHRRAPAARHTSTR